MAKEKWAKAEAQAEAGQAGGYLGGGCASGGWLSC